MIASTAQVAAANSRRVDEAPRWELLAGTDGLAVFAEGSQQFNLFGRARYELNQLLQLGGSVAYHFQSVDVVSDTGLQVLMGPTFNFAGGEAGSADAFFATPQAGLTAGRTVFGQVVQGANTQATLGLELGKRFRLSRSLSYSPSIGLVKEWDFGPKFLVQPLSVSFFM